jgi:hypothetical protein
MEELDAFSALRLAIAKVKQRWSDKDGWPKIYYLVFLRASEGTLSRWSRLHLQSLAPTNPHWVHVMGYGPFSLYVNHKEGLCSAVGTLIGWWWWWWTQITRQQYHTKVYYCSCKSSGFTYFLIIISLLLWLWSPSVICLVWCPGQNKRIAPLSFFHWCRKMRLKDWHLHLS